MCFPPSFFFLSFFFLNQLYQPYTTTNDLAAHKVFLYQYQCLHNRIKNGTTEMGYIIFLKQKAHQPTTVLLVSQQPAGTQTSRCSGCTRHLLNWCGIYKGGKSGSQKPANQKWFTETSQSVWYTIITETSQTITVWYTIVYRCFY